MLKLVFFLHVSVSMGHINTIGSLERSSMSPKAKGSGAAAIGEVSCRSMAALSRLAPYGGEAPPPYEWTPSVSVEDVVSDGRMDGGRASSSLVYAYLRPGP